jgi:N utilization substance protein B
MGVRRRGREYALQMLFAMDLTEYQPEQIFAGYNAIQDLSRDAFIQARHIVDGFFSHREEIDGLLSKYAKHWKISRMAVVDRNLLRLAIYELKFQPEIPFPIILNEALEISREFSEVESSPFINGILDTARRELRPDEPNGKTSKKKKPKEPDTLDSCHPASGSAPDGE